MKQRLFLRVIALFIGLPALAQEPAQLTLEQAYELAIRNYPLTRQLDLVKRTAELNMKNISSGYYPQFSLNGQASYQSEVTTVPVRIPAFEFEPLGKDQYKIAANLNQLIYDGGQTHSQHEVIREQQKVDEQRIEVEYQKLKTRINDIWFSILLTDEQVNLVNLSQKDIDAVILKVEAQVKGGTAFRSSLAGLQAEKLRNEQRIVELKANRLSLLDILSLFIRQALPENTNLVKPASTLIPQPDPSFRRPELELIRNQQRLLDAQSKLIDVRNRPRFSLYAEGGYGRPGLNFLLNEFQFYYIGGVRLNWNFGNLYTAPKERDINQLNRQSFDIQEELFLLNARAEVKQYWGDIGKYEKLMQTDEAIISLKHQVKEAASAQLENGIITSSDYIREVNAEEQSRQNLILHQLQLLQTKINYSTTTGN